MFFSLLNVNVTQCYLVEKKLTKIFLQVLNLIIYKPDKYQSYRKFVKKRFFQDEFLFEIFDNFWNYYFYQACEAMLYFRESKRHETTHLHLHPWCSDKIYLKRYNKVYLMIFAHFIFLINISRSNFFWEISIFLDFMHLNFNIFGIRNSRSTQG